jgi:hypothetical protein
VADSDLTVSILREIRDEIRTTNQHLDTTRVELKAEISAARVELKAEIGETNQRLDVVEVTLKDLAGQQLVLTRYLKNVIDRHDERLTRLETRLDER